MLQGFLSYGVLSQGVGVSTKIPMILVINPISILYVLV